MTVQSTTVAAVSTPSSPGPQAPDLGRAAALTLALIDDAAVFPPGSASVDDALVAHRRHRTSWYADLVGPLLARASAVRELAAALDTHGSAADPVEVVLVADAGLVGLAEARAALLDDDRLEVVGVEVAIPAGDDLGAAARRTLDALDVAVPAAVEVPRGSGWREALDVLADDGAERAKFRTGGPTPDAVPSDHQLALFVHACLERRLPFKLTAGLHHLVRRTAPRTGMEEHGLLNVLAAVAAGLDGGSVEVMQEMVSLRDEALLRAVIDTADARDLRRWFTSFGSCSIDEPRDELVAAGLLVPPHDADVEGLL